MKVSVCFLSVTLCGALFAQSAASRPEALNTITQSVKQISPETTFQPETAPQQPPILNILTVIGDTGIGVPCLDCLLGILIPTLGLPSPLGKVLRGTKYQVDSYLIDNSYTGPCTFTFALTDSKNNVIASTTQTLNEKANTEILLNAPLDIPTSAGIGLDTVSTTAKCGSSTTQSRSPVMVACVTNPPFCLE